eukprot:14826085-Alexandrium_andersonii.AAC.1
MPPARPAAERHSEGRGRPRDSSSPRQKRAPQGPPQGMPSWFPAVPQPTPGTAPDVWQRLKCRPAAPHDRRGPGRAVP